MKKWVKVVDTKPICGHKNGHKGLTLWTQNELVDTKLNGKNCGHKMRVGAKVVDTKPICGHKSRWLGVILWTQNELVDTKTLENRRKTAKIAQIFSTLKLYYFLLIIELIKLLFTLQL